MTGIYAPETPTYAACMRCGADWFAWFPPGVPTIACPVCDERAGEPVQIRNSAWIARFTGCVRAGGREWKRRALVCLNAKRMETGG